VTIFLSVEDVLLIHEDAILEEGGAPGVRDLGLLESAVAQPGGAFFGVMMHPDFASQAAAYVFHIASNHPFVDGNKRAAAASAAVFLKANGQPLPDFRELRDLTLAVAAGQASKDDAIAFFRKLV
jgi:death-on-curing protein